VIGMMKTLLIAVSLIAVSGAAQAGSKKSFGCGYQSSLGGDAHKAFLKKNAQNGMAERLLNHFTSIWQLEEQKRICEAYGRGEPAEFGCLIDRRDYDAILAKMPKNYGSLSKEDLHNWVLNRELSLSAEGNRYKDITYNACVKAGVYKGKLRKVN
jgi:hypothetical protein